MDAASTVFRALSDPTRRQILVLLSRQEMSIGDVADRFDMTRPAIAKHLRILGEGDLIRVESRGRSRINRLNPEPLRAVHDWLEIFDRFWDDKLSRLIEEVETET